MPIDAGFDNAFSLRLKLRAAERRIAELESGGAYADLKARTASLQREYEAKVRKLERELGARGGRTRRRPRPGSRCSSRSSASATRPSRMR